MTTDHTTTITPKTLTEEQINDWWKSLATRSNRDAFTLFDALGKGIRTANSECRRPTRAEQKDARQRIGDEVNAQRLATVIERLRSGALTLQVTCRNAAAQNPDRDLDPFYERFVELSSLLVELTAIG